MGFRFITLIHTPIHTPTYSLTHTYK